MRLQTLFNPTILVGEIFVWIWKVYRFQIIQVMPHHTSHWCKFRILLNKTLIDFKMVLTHCITLVVAFIIFTFIFSFVLKCYNKSWFSSSCNSIHTVVTSIICKVNYSSHFCFQTIRDCIVHITIVCHISQHFD